MLSLSLATRLALTYNLPMLCTITSHLLASIGIVAGSYLLLVPRKKATTGDLVIARADGRTIIGLYYPDETDTLLYLPDRPVIVQDHAIIGELVPLDWM